MARGELKRSWETTNINNYNRSRYTFIKKRIYNMEHYRPRLYGDRRTAFEHLTKKQSRVLVIGDLHEPFCLDKYLDFCLDIQARYLTNKTIFIGDIIDSHGWSYHELDPDGLSAGSELSLAIKRIARWYDAFPKADVLIGNHDRMASRKAMSGGVPSAWIKGYNEVLRTPNWNWTDRVVIDDVQYLHGEGGTARTKCRADLQSTIQGHLHTQAYCDHYVGAHYKIFGCQVGCGIDFDQYSFAYAKRGKKPAIGVGVCIGGTTCINELMNLGTQKDTFF